MRQTWQLAFLMFSFVFFVDSAKRVVPATVCLENTQAAGGCVNDLCPDSYACINNQCCGPPSAANSTNLLTTCSQVDSNRPCLPDNTCPDPGFNCDLNNQWCCPNIAGDPLGLCMRAGDGTRLCPDGYACLGPDNGQCYRLETGTCVPQNQVGPCHFKEPKCQPGCTCIGGFCCSDNATTFSTFRGQKRSFPSS